MKYLAATAMALTVILTGPVRAQDSYDCLIDPSLVVEIGSAEAGIIERILVSRGDSVTRGQIIAELESGAEMAALDYARARAEDSSPIEIARSRVEILGADAARARELGQRNIMSDAAVAAVQGDYEQAVLELRQAEFEKSLAALDQTRVEAQIARRVIKSPVDGIVITRMIGPGEYVFAQAPVAQIAKIDPLHIEVFLPTEMFPSLAIGDLATVMPAAPIGGDHEARITVIDRVFDAASDTFGVRLALDNPGGDLVAGIDCRIRFND